MHKYKMESYCLKCKKYTKNINPQVSSTNNSISWSEEIFIIKKITNTVPWTYVINDLNGEEIIGAFYENELQDTKQE